MPRGRKKKLPPEGQLQVTIEEIANAEIHLKELKAKKIDLEKQVKEQKLTELNQLIEESGLSFEAVKEKIQSN